MDQNIAQQLRPSLLELEDSLRILSDIAQQFDDHKIQVIKLQTNSFDLARACAKLFQATIGVRDALPRISDRHNNILEFIYNHIKHYESVASAVLDAIDEADSEIQEIAPKPKINLSDLIKRVRNLSREATVAPPVQPMTDDTVCQTL